MALLHPAEIEIEPLLAYQFIVEADRSKFHCAGLKNPSVARPNENLLAGNATESSRHFVCLLIWRNLVCLLIWRSVSSAAIATDCRPAGTPETAWPGR